MDFAGYIYLPDGLQLPVFFLSAELTADDEECDNDVVAAEGAAG